MKSVLLTLFVCLGCSFARAADGLVLLRDGKSDYQIVVPDRSPTEELAACLRQCARLLQSAFAANGAEIRVVAESERDASPAIFLGDTAYAREHLGAIEKLTGWSYSFLASERDVVIAGHDAPSPVAAEIRGKREPAWDFIGTAKGAVDFARQYLGVRFLYPEVAERHQVSAAAAIELRASPALEFLPMKTIAVPADLFLTKTPLLRINTAYPPGGSFYDLALNRFPRVDESFGGHTWERAIPAAFFAGHPEYFALINGERLKPANGAQYCLSNPQVQEMIYRDLASRLEAGYGSVDLGQPDGFRPCQCEKCAALYGTGSDWGEKIWIFNRSMAEQLQQSHPGKFVTMMSYILTAAPPKTFYEFPANTRIMLTGTNEEDIAPWWRCAVPGGFTGYVYNWCPNLASRYTPMRTPAYVETQAKRLAANQIKSIYRDGPGQLFGLEGPVYYVMGRMFDDPERNAARDLVPEFCDAAFGKAAPAMRSFYEQLYHTILLYSDHLGTRDDVWTYQTLEGRRRKTLSDPFQLIAFLYTPGVLAGLESNLHQAESLAETDKVWLRLGLVRREFEYVRNLARVVHLYHAFVLQPDAGSRERLLDAIDARNAAIDALYDERGRPKAVAGWARQMFPFSGHAASHLRLEEDGYQEPFANTCLNWNTAAMRNAPLPGKKRLTVKRASGGITLDSADWKIAEAQELTAIPPLSKAPRKTLVQVLHDDTRLYLRAECELEPDGRASFPGAKRDTDLRTHEALDIYLAPDSRHEIAYRFMAGANAAAKYDAVAGLITEAMDPRHGKDDPSWNGEWQSETRVDAAGHRWETLLTIPFQTLKVEPPKAGVVWRGNFGRNHPTVRQQVDRAIWSSEIGKMNMDDRTIFGELVFE